MMQLWLDFKRIDSIPQLRAAFASRDAEGRRALFRQLWRKHFAGLFLPWLARCAEARIRRRDLKGDADITMCTLNLESARRRLENAGADSPQDDVRDALAEICGVDPAEFPAEAVSERTASSRRGKHCAKVPKELLERQAWYRASAALRRGIDNLDPSRLVTDSDSLNRVLARLSKRQDEGVADVYLLAVDDNGFFLRSIDKLRHVRLVGYGKPVLHFSANDGTKTLDMVGADVKFEGLALDEQGVRITRREGRCTDVQEETFSRAEGDGE